MSVNQVHLLGRCGQDLEVRIVGQNNVSRATFSLCTGSKYRTHDGREVDDTAWHNIVAWRGLADLVQKHIRKGSQVFIIGHLTYRKYTDSNGTEKSVTEIVADKIELCGSRSETTSSVEKVSPMGHAPAAIDDIGDLPPDDGMPF